MDEQIKKMEQLLTYDGPDKVVDSVEMREYLEKQLENEVKLNSGITGLDEICEGFEGGELIVVAGATKNGKSLFCQSITYFMQDRQKNQETSLWFSFEMPTKQLVKRFPRSTFFYLPQEIKTNAMTWIEDRIIEAQAKYGNRVVMIDHLHFLFDMAMRENISLKIGQIVRQLKQIAMRNNVVIFLICHLKKTQLNAQPDLDDLRDSSFIAQESDSVIMISRGRFTNNEGDEEYTDESKAFVKTHRRTGAMNKKISLKYSNGLLYEL